MKLKIILLNICLPLFFGSSCDKEPDNTVLTNNKWELKHIEIENNVSEPPIDYILEFLNDSLFTMYLSVNEGKGIYNIAENNQITILSYDPITEACCETNFDYMLLNNFPKVKEYKIDGKKLLFSSENLEIEFRMK